MSWDVIIVNSLEKYPPEKVWDGSMDALPFGPIEEMHKKINAFFPKTTWFEPAYTKLDNGLLVGNISFSENEPVFGSFTLNIYRGTDPINMISLLCAEYNWTAFDTSTSEYIENGFQNNNGWEQFNKYKQQVLKTIEIYKYN